MDERSNRLAGEIGCIFIEGVCEEFLLPCVAERADDLSVAL